MKNLKATRARSHFAQHLRALIDAHGVSIGELSSRLGCGRVLYHVCLDQQRGDFHFFTALFDELGLDKTQRGALFNEHAYTHGCVPLDIEHDLVYKVKSYNKLRKFLKEVM